MPVAILYFKSNSVIHDFYDNITDVKSQKIEFVGGYLEGWNEDEIGVMVVDTLIINLDEQEKHLIDSKGSIYNRGDVLPSELIDIKSQYIKLADTEILGQQMTEREIESMEQGQQITDLELRMLLIEGAN
ncbi:hypothetical protein ACIQXF_04665 [Lysinibacillus sp. NPDC097231]|uniref:hypothetical protein n=1 Tax=Lysinibacillus sp. NPDC097231 TaxID=3364142 RepID=UPI00380AAE47